MQAEGGAESRQDVFRRIYRKGEWGGEGTYYSGPGSDERFAARYVELVRDFIALHDEIDVVVDLGCGDFRIGREVSEACDKYVGIDIVPELIAAHTQAHGSETTEFLCADIVADELPAGELVLIRQVLQHLSNEDVARVLRRLGQFRWAIITEHNPSSREEAHANLDKPTGRLIRLNVGGGLYFDEPPFGLDDIDLIDRVPYNDLSCLETYLWTPPCG